MTTAITPAADQPATGPEVEQAEQEATEAAQLLAALEERVREGDEQVTPQQLAQARELGRFAALRTEAARRKAERAAAKEAEARRARTTAEAVALLDQQAAPVAVAAAYATARTALVALLAAVTDHDDAIRKAAYMLRQAGAAPITRYVPVQRGEHTFSEPEYAPASRTAPTVEPQHHTAALSIETGRTRLPVGTGPTLATLLADTFQTHDVRMPAGEPAFTAAPLDSHIRRHGDAVRRFLDQAADQMEGAK